jgi:choline kinase
VIFAKKTAEEIQVTDQECAAKLAALAQHEVDAVSGGGNWIEVDTDTGLSCDSKWVRVY